MTPEDLVADHISLVLECPAEQWGAAWLALRRAAACWRGAGDFRGYAATTIWHDVRADQARERGLRRCAGAWKIPNSGNPRTWGSAGGKIGGRLQWQKMTPEQRRAKMAKLWAARRAAASQRRECA